MDFGQFEGKNYEELKDDPAIRSGSTAMEHCHFPAESQESSLSGVPWKVLTG